MPLGLFAKDSIQDLEALGRESESKSNKAPVLPHRPSSPYTNDTREYSQTLLIDESDAVLTSENDLRDSRRLLTANPQQAQEADLAAPFESRAIPTASYGQYAGFQASYHHYENYSDTHLGSMSYGYHDTYAPVVTGQKESNSNFWCCLFPWMNGFQKNIDNKQSNREGNFEEVKSLPQAPSDDDDRSSSSEKLGERLSTKERQAVLARLRLAQPDIASPTLTSESQVLTNEKGLLNGIAIDTRENVNSRKLKSILRRKATVSNNSSITSKNKNEPDVTSQRRRSLFPAYESSRSKSEHPVTFSPMARVVTVKSKNDMDSEEKGAIWWQKEDYEDFRKTSRVITKAMLEGGSEIWLASSDYQHSLHRASNDSKTGGQPDRFLDSTDTITATGDKWWHRFGHSRRGLEHVVSIEEGRQRQLNVRTAIQAVLEEQQRQKMYGREDPDRLRIVSLNHTSWARDLALASGSSDADAVKSSFAEDRKSREFYLLKMARTSPVVTGSRRLPEFMQPVMHTAKPLAVAQRLDANTSAQIKFRKQMQDKEQSERLQKETSEPIQDRDDKKSDVSLAQRAAGFSAQIEKHNMAAVLSGMGVVAS